MNRRFFPAELRFQFVICQPFLPPASSPGGTQWRCPLPTSRSHPSCVRWVRGDLV